MKGKQQDFRTERFYRYGIRKYSFGAASVAIATGLMFLGNGVVSANTVESSSTEATRATATEASSSSSSDSSTTAESVTPVTPAVATEVPVTPQSADASAAKTVEVSEAATATVSVNKESLKAKVAELEAKLAAAVKGTDAQALATARETLASAKAVLDSATASQAQVEEQTSKVSLLVTVVAEASAKATASAQEAQKAEEAKKAPAEKTELEKKVSEAVVTNRLANDFVEKEAKEKNVSVDLTDAVKTAVSANEATVASSEKVLADQTATTDAYNASIAQLNASIEAVYVSLRKAGKDEFEVSLTPDSYYAEATANADGTRTTHAETVTADNATGKDIYKFNANGTASNDGSASAGDINAYTSVTGGTAEGLEVIVYSNQRDGEEINPASGLFSANGGQIGHNNKGRMDYPLSAEMAKKLAVEAEMWRGKLRPSGSTIFSGSANVFSNGGAYEFLATEIYKLAYEQGVDRVYIPGFKSRFGVTAEAALKGWSLTSVNPENLPPGLTYDATNDVVEGIITSNLENGVYDTRVTATFTNSTTGATVSTSFRNMRMGWIGWMDTTPPVIATNNAVFERTVGDDIDIDLKYQDASGARTMNAGGANVTYTKANGTNTTIRQTYTMATTGVAGVNTGSQSRVLTDSETTIPGAKYQMDPNRSSQSVVVDGQQTYNSTGKLYGALTEAGVYYVATYAKDYNRASAQDQWIQSGQETQGNLTVVIKPKVEALNIETYSETVPVTISKGATNAVVTMPDGTKTVLQNQNGKWVVIASGEDVDGNTVTTTNTAATVGTDLGTVGDKINIPVTQTATATAGVDNIKVEAITENIKGTFLRNKVTLTDVDGSTHEATLSTTTGHWELPEDYATVQTTNADGTYTLTKRQVYTEAQDDGSENFYIYSYTRTFATDGTIKSVGDVTRHKTTIASKNATSAEGMAVTVTYDKYTDTWTASDGSTVTATHLGDTSWDVKTSSGFGGEIRGRKATHTDVATIINTQPTARSTSYESTKGTTVDLRNATQAAVTIADKEDTAHSKTTYITRLTVTSPSGAQKVYDTKTDAAAYTLASDYVLSEVGVYTVVVEVIDSNGNIVTATLDGTDSGTDSGAGSSVAKTTYTITVKDTITGHNVTSSDIQGATQTGTPTFTSVGDGSTISPSATSPAKLVAADNSLVTELEVANQGTYTIDSETGVVTFKPLPTFTGPATPVTVSLTAVLGTDANGANITATATATYTPTVVPVQPTAVASKTSGPQGQAQTSAIKFDAADTDDTTVNFAKGTVAIDANTTKSVDLNTATVTLLDANGNETTTVTVDDEGTYTLDKTTNTITFQPVATFTGTVTKPVSVRVADANGTTATTTYTPTVTDVTMTAENATSEDVQGKTQTGTPTFETSDPSVTIAKRQLINPETGTVTDDTSVTIENEGTYTLNPTTGVVTFVPVPTFTGEGTGVTVQATDSNGETATATYTPTVTPITITSENVTSKDIQGEEQSETPLFESSDASAPVSSYKLVDPATGNPTTETSVTVENVGTYTIDATTGEVTFKPVASYTGTPAAVTVQASATITNANGESTTITGTATYTPTVVPVTPTAVASETSGVQGQTQTSEIVFDDADEDKTTVNFAKGTTTIDDVEKSVELDKATVTLLDASGNPATTVTVENEGTYTLDGTTISFTPVANFVGTASGVSVRVADANGTTATTTYTPTVTDVTMTAEDATSTDVQGKTQTGTPSFETSDPSVTIATRQLLDPTTNQPTNTVTIANEGTYTIDPTTGVVTFVPVPTFTGDGTGVTVQATDSNGETATATYTPTVTPITITSENVTSKDIQGEEQSETPLFVSSDTSAPVSSYKLVDPATGTATDATSVTVENVGTYTIDATTGEVTFKPVASYTGTPAAVTVQASATITNANGESTTITGTATYTPTVVPVTPTAQESATAGKQGQAQTSQIIFDTPDTDTTTLNFAKGESSEVLGADGQPKSVALDKTSVTLLDADGNAVTTVTVDGEGTYTLDKATNVITFQPTEEFTGTATPVRVQIADVNGTTTETTYTPTVIAEDGSVIVEYKDEEGNVISPSTTPVNNEKVTTPFTTEPKEIPGYTLVKVETTNGTVDEESKKVSGKVTNEPTTVTYTYKKNVQTATISYYDVTTGTEVAIDTTKVPEATVETVEGTYKDAIDFANRETAIAALEKAGYELVEDSFTAATTADKLFDNDTTVDQTFKVTVQQRVEPVTPNDETPVPGQPVDPEDPNSPVWPNTAENLELTKTVTRTIKYRYNDENGAEVTADVVQTVTFTRTANINLVTGDVTYGDWSAAQ
ncbi:MucBP domain-containing protein, partial [Streptococcus sp. DD10]|uniref:MucBP domain-containing protein n=1 Tax=Streptococcus sp. DD10 TaxID=1777878 RepID=UPI000836BAD0